MAITLFLVAMAVFLALTVLPGDAARLVVGPEATPARYEAVRRALGLDQPWPVRFLRWLGEAMRGNLGRSLRYPSFSVAELLGRGLTLTFPLALLAALTSFLLGIALGILSAAHLGSFLDLTLSTVSQAFLAIPEFWLGIILISLFSVRFPLFPAGGFPGWEEPQAWWHLVLPWAALALPRAAYFARLARGTLADALGQEFTRTARAKGLPEHLVLLRHALRPALVPLLAGFALTFARLLAGALVIEQVFSLPGLGKLAVDAAFGRDIPLLLGLSLLVTGTVVAVHTLTDLLYVLLDPRIRYA